MRWCAILVALLAASSAPDDALHVRAIQHRGWWEVRYADGTVAANEMHVPAARRVVVDLALDGAGVLWFDDGHWPRVGRGASVAFTLTPGGRAGVHARGSALLVIGDAHFDEWLARQRSDAAPPANARGREVFTTARCTLCHTVRGVANAEEPAGPDLTHVASRSTLGAGVVPNRPGFLSGWIVDAETIKPGCGMPVNNIASEDLEALLSYMQSLR